MKTHIFLTFLVIALSISTSAYAAGDSPLQSYIEEALKNNPSLTAAEARIEAAEQEVPQSSALPDPMLSVGIQNLPNPSFDFQQEPMTGKWISLSQTFPFPGVRSLSRGIAEERVRTNRSLFDETQLSLIQNLRQTYYRWAEVRGRIELVERNRDLLKQLVDVTTASYRVGKGAQQDILRAQTEWLKYDDRLLELKQMETNIKASFRALLGRETQEELELPESLTVVSVDTMSADKMKDLLANNPSLQGYNARLALTEKQTKLAGRMRYPNFGFGAKYTQRENAPSGTPRDDFWSFQLTTSIPLFAGSKQNRMIEQRQIEQQQIKAEYENLKLKLKAKLTELETSMQTYARQALLFDTAIIPQAKQAFAASLADYKFGRIGFSDLIASQRAIYDAEQKLLDRVLSFQLAKVKIEALTASTLINQQH